ncbi:MAG: acetyl-CoA acetyltransferase [Betaproteobacteria bacterium RIFCSPLOWO2_02_67_12]|nr:MAG: acetyl-CoA acetyltransferase [Betaproteobacteria bacterium RIFCSPLOWO2_02_67_12]OGA57202.1 MAG: acetyl-CoA acetyltransferase [Betaproteobacteria bacterium RIFCSPLOWO2_12_FULL_67_28]
MSGPLAGVRVLDLTTVVMGPFATQVLADFGADVIKVEPPEGDIMRHAAPMRSPGMGHIFLNANRNKRSAVLDLKQAGGRDACLALAARSDVLVYNIRPQAMARLKLSYADVCAANPCIVYVGAFGYSPRGPYAARAAYDDLIQGAVGLPWLLAQSGASEPRYAPAAIADRTVGLHIVNAVCAALYSREKSGRGQRVDVPMFEHLLQTVLGEHLGGYTFEPQLGEPGYARMLAKGRRPYQTKDGYVCVLVYNDKQWRAFFRLIDRQDLLADARFATQEARSRNYDVAYELVAQAMNQRGTDEWIAALEAADIPVQRMNSLGDIVNDPHLAAIGFFHTVEHPSEGRLKSMAVPSEWSVTAPEHRRHAPRLGEHTREVLREAGLADSRIDALVASGAARL